MTDTQAIQQAIEQLVAASKANTARIDSSKAASAKLQEEIKIFSLELKRDTPHLTLIDKKSLTVSRRLAGEDDCNLLKASMESISKHIKDNQTTEALALMEPLTLNVSLLRKRLQYIVELEQLLHEYEQEKTIRAKLKAVADVLGLPLYSSVDTQADDSELEKTLKVVESIGDNYPVPVIVASPTFH